MQVMLTTDLPALKSLNNELGSDLSDVCHDRHTPVLFARHKQHAV